MHELAEQVLSHLKAIWRYRWYAVVFAWVIALGGWFAVYKMPERYMADARFYVDTQSVLRPLLQGLAVQPNLDQVVGMMSRTLVSRPNLEKLIQMAGLEDGTMTDQARAQLINRLSSEISIKSAGEKNLYTISCVDKDPEVAKRVVQSLLTLFVEGSAVDNRKDSDSARRFIDEQLEGYREKLVAAEKTISEFKRRNQGLMPGGGPDYFGRVVETRTALSQATLELREAEHARDSIRSRLAGEPQVSPVTGEKMVSEVIVPETEIDIRIRALGQKLDNLRTTFTDQHPDIVATVRILDQLKEQKLAEAQRSEAEARQRVSQLGASAPATRRVDPVYQGLTVSLTEAEAKVAAMKTRVDEYSRRYAELQTLVNAVPQIEAEYTKLTRDYDVYKARYDELLKRRDTAQISGDMEASDVAMAFRVIDPPRVVRATRDPRLLTTVVLLAALGGGLGVAFLISQIKPTINDEYRLREVSGLRVLGTVVMNMTGSQNAKRKRGLVGLVISVASLLSTYAAIMAALFMTASRV